MSCGAGTASAHEVSSVSLVAKLDTEKRTYLLDAAMEVVPSEDDARNDRVPPEQAAREFAEEFLVVLFDEEEVEPAIDISIEEASDEETPASLQRQQVLTQLSGDFPDGATEFLLYLEPDCPMAVVMVVVKDDRSSRRMQVVLAGEYSRPVNVEPVVEGDPFEEGGSEEGGDSEGAAKPAPPEKPSAPPAVPVAAAPPSGAAPDGEVKEGAEGGRDGASGERDGASPFVAGWKTFFAASWLPAVLPLAVFLLTIRRRAVLAQLAALLITQSVVLALAAWGAVPTPGWAAPALGLVVAAAGMEALVHAEMRWWRLPLVSAAGILAGLALAGAAPFRRLFSNSSGASAKDVLLCVAGTETGFVLVALVAVAVLLSTARFSWQRRSVVQPLAALVAGYGLFVAVDGLL